MALYLYLAALLALGVPPGQTQIVNFTRTSIDTEVGLYYESMYPIRFAKGEWRLVTFIDLNTFEQQKPFVSPNALRGYEAICAEFEPPERCAAMFDTTYLDAKYELADKYMKHIQSLMDVQPEIADREDMPTVKRSVPLGFIGGISRALFGTLNEEDAQYYNREIDKLYEGERQMAILAANQTHIVKSEFHRVHNEIDSIKNRTERQSLLLNEMVLKLHKLNKIEHQISMVSHMDQWMRHKELEIDSYVNDLQTIIHSIYFARLGFIHPGLITPQMLANSVVHFLRHNDNKAQVFPLSLEEVRAGELGKISKTSIGYHEGKLLLILHVPLLDPRAYHLHRMHPFPTLQIFGDNKRGSAYIQPRTDYLVISQEQAVYTLFHENDLPHCSETRDYHICSPSYPFYKSAMQPICETSLMTGDKHEPFEDCDIRISKTFNPYWKQLNNMKAWLYSLPEEEKIYIICGDASRESVTISGSGILRVKHGCHAHTSYASFMGYQIINQEEDYQYTSTVQLNISDILPGVESYEPLRVPYNLSDIPRVETGANIPGVLSYDVTLDEIQKNLENIGQRKREKQREEKRWFWTILSQGVIGGGLLLYLLRTPAVWVFWKVVRSCINCKSNDKTIEEKSSASNHTDEPIYAAPSTRGVF